jgi:hypothetical protein
MKRAYQYDFDEQDAREYAEACIHSCSMLSFGIFQWIPTADGKRLKKSKAVRRVKFRPDQIDAAIKAAKSIVNELHLDNFSSPKTTTIK